MSWFLLNQSPVSKTFNSYNTASRIVNLFRRFSLSAGILDIPAATRSFSQILFQVAPPNTEIANKLSQSCLSNLTLFSAAPVDHRLLAGRVSPTIRMKLAGSRAFPNKLHPMNHSALKKKTRGDVWIPLYLKTYTLLTHPLNLPVLYVIIVN